MIKAGEVIQVDGSMQVESIMGEEVVVTAMMRGQTAAISQQVNSNTIVNVVSKEKIMELPDQNAAETVARLPGVSLVRDGGEGTKVTLRGMAPRFNSITIDGAKVPSTSDQDRSVDLSMFSTDALVRDRVLQGPASRYGRGCHRGTDQFHIPHCLRADSMGMRGCRQAITSSPKASGSTREVHHLKTGFLMTGWVLSWVEEFRRAERSTEGFTGDFVTESGKDADGNTIFTVRVVKL